MGQNKAGNRPLGNPNGYSTVLMARFSAIGDVAMTIPAVYSACRCYPDVRFVMLTRSSMAGLFLNPPTNLIVVGVDLKEYYRGIGGMRDLARTMYERFHPDIFLDLHNVLRTQALSLFLRLKGVPTVRIFKQRAQRRALTRRNNKLMLPLSSQRARYREVFYHAGLPVSDCFDGVFNGRNTSDPAIFAAITPPKKEGEIWIGIAPFAAHTGKIYPPGKMEEVIKRLQADADSGRKIKIFLLGGGKEEQEILERWADKYPVAISLAGKRHGFPIEMALFNHLDALVTMDSANMHIGAITLAPTISIWGATHPYCGFKGWRQTEESTIQLPLECRPCSVFGDKPCFRGDLLCLNAIKPELIYNKIIATLENKEA